MGFRAIYIAGTIFVRPLVPCCLLKQSLTQLPLAPQVNMPWQADSYSPIDFSLTDPHWGTLDDWRDLIDEMHSRGMYIMLDFTVGTMNDFIAFEGCVACRRLPYRTLADRFLPSLAATSTRRRRSA